MITQEAVMGQLSKRHERLNQRGQSLIWFLAMIVASCIVLALVYNIGQVTNEKEKTVNAADAAALSGALVEARVLNFTAYTNRAMIANEVTIAQLISADSFIRYDTKLATYLAEYLQVVGVVPFVGEAIVAALDEYADVMQSVVQPAVDDIVGPSIRACDFTIVALESAREVAVSLAPIAADQVANGVAEANKTILGGRFDEQPELNGAIEAWNFGLNGAAWVQFIDHNDTTFTDAEQVITNSRDPFSVHRDMGTFIQGVSAVLDVGITTLSGGWEGAQLTKTSGTTQLVDSSHWASQDTLDVQITSRSICWHHWLPEICSSTNYAPVPLGYGRTDANNDDSTAKNLCQPNTLNCHLAVDDTEDPYQANAIPNIFDLSDQGRRNPTLTFVAAVQKKADAALTTPRAQMEIGTAPVRAPLGSPSLVENMQNADQLTAIASAQISFKRPDWSRADVSRGNLPRPDQLHEYASLYNPYWQARLAPTEPATKALLYTTLFADPRGAVLSEVTP